MIEPLFLNLEPRRFEWEPLSPAASAFDPEPHTAAYIEGNWAICDGYTVLRHEMYRYCCGLIRGQSFLVAGHRGSGKTLLTHLAIQINRWRITKGLKLTPKQGDDESKLPKEAPQAIPFLVPIHGPDLLSSCEPLTQNNPIALSEVAMGQILLSLQKSFKEEILLNFRIALEHRPLQEDHLAELSRELLGASSASSLARFWDRFQVMSEGVLGATLKESKLSGYSIKSSGRDEILLLEALNQAAENLQVVQDHSPAPPLMVGNSDGNFMRVNVRQLKAYGALIAPILSVAIAIFAVTQVGEGAPKELGWLVPGIVFFLTLAISKKMLSRDEYGFPDGGMLHRNSLPELDRALPLLVSRLHQCGYAPIFVVDELDKINDVEKRMLSFMKQLKYFATDEAFFCFLTDRKYFEKFEAKLERHKYPEEQTYFGHRILVHYTAEAIEKYIDYRFGAEQ